MNDRDLDARVATEVLGWTVAERDGQKDFYPEQNRKRYRIGRMRLPNTLRTYSTDIASAWTIIDHLRSQGWDYELLSDGSQHYAVFCKDVDDPYAASADTAAAAICLAALKAVEAT